MDENFSRLKYQASAFAQEPSAAIRGFTVPLKIGSRDAYFVDEVGNVSTSRFRVNSRESMVELIPRYPLFGGWNYFFTIGWNINLDRLLKYLPDEEKYFLRVPFIEGPENVYYETVELSILYRRDRGITSFFQR